jgi:predicted ATPase
MLKRFRVNNFRSLLNFEFRPVGTNVLIGPNNAGKTNLCSALRFLGLTASLPLEDAIRTSVGETWNIRNVYTSDQDIEIQVECTLAHRHMTIDFEYSLSLRVQTKPSGFGQALYVSNETLKATGGGFAQTLLLESTGSEVKLAYEMWSGWPGSQAKGSVHDRTTVSLSSGTTALSQLHPGMGELATLFREYLLHWAYYAFSPYSLRSSKVVRESPVLLSDGKNMARTYFSLHNENPRLEKQLIDVIRTLEPRLDLFTYTSPDPDSVFLFMEDQKRNRFSTQSISDGTLRFMAMAYLVFSREDSMPDLPAGLTVIEEPENGLYVGHLKPLFERLMTRGRKDQFIFTTHSPYFIDLFDSCLEGVHVMKPGAPSSEIKKPDLEKTKNLLSAMPLGELYYRGMLA